MEQTRGQLTSLKLNAICVAVGDRECDCRAFVGAAYAIFLDEVLKPGAGHFRVGCSWFSDRLQLIQHPFPEQAEASGNLLDTDFLRWGQSPSRRKRFLNGPRPAQPPRQPLGPHAASAPIAGPGPVRSRLCIHAMSRDVGRPR